MNNELAYFLGCFLGDGWIESDKTAMYIAGSMTEDKEHYDTILEPLFSKHVAPTKARPFPYWHVYGITTYKGERIKKMIELGFPVGKKSYTAVISPDFYNKEQGKYVVQGLFDTDGSFWCEKSNAPTSTVWKRTHNYIPLISISSCSEELLKQVQTILVMHGIESILRHKTRAGRVNNRNNKDSYELKVRKRESIDRFLSTIGTQNPRHITRIEVWRKLGHLPPNTNISNRKLILKKLI